MYKTFRELVIATRAKFSDQEYTNGGMYSPNINPIGCAIGCHFPSEQQLTLDFGDGYTSIGNIIKLDVKKSAMVREVIGEAITYQELRMLQDWHDQYKLAKDFIAIMDLWLGTIEEEPVTSDLFTRAAALDAIPY
jgi:hypothetical protein